MSKLSNKEVFMLDVRTPYPVTLYFHQEFTQGLLKGMDMEDKLGFCTVRDARHWVECINERNAEGKIDYKVTAFSIRF
jgi:hypothetical protein